VRTGKMQNKIGIAKSGMIR